MAQQVQTQIDVPERHRTLVAPLRADERNDNLAHVVTLREANEDGFHCRDIGVRLAVPVEDREVLEDVAELRPCQRVGVGALAVAEHCGEDRRGSKVAVVVRHRKERVEQVPFRVRRRDADAERLGPFVPLERLYLSHVDRESFCGLKHDCSPCVLDHGDYPPSSRIKP